MLHSNESGRARHERPKMAPLRLVVDTVDGRRHCMSKLGIMDGSVLETFDRLCELAKVRTKGSGVTLGQLGDAAALARELEKQEPDSERVEVLASRLGLETEEVAR